MDSVENFPSHISTKFGCCLLDIVIVIRDMYTEGKTTGHIPGSFTVTPMHCDKKVHVFIFLITP